MAHFAVVAFFSRKTFFSSLLFLLCVPKFDTFFQRKFAIFFELLWDILLKIVAACLGGFRSVTAHSGGAENLKTFSPSQPLLLRPFFVVSSAKNVPPQHLTGRRRTFFIFKLSSAFSRPYFSTFAGFKAQKAEKGQQN